MAFEVIVCLLIIISRSALINGLIDCDLFTSFANYLKVQYDKQRAARCHF